MIHPAKMLQKIDLINTSLHWSGWISLQRIESFCAFFFLLQLGISLSPIIHCLWSTGLHVCQLCSLAFMSTDLNNKPHSLTWRPYIFLFKLYTAMHGILTATYDCPYAVFPLDSFLLSPFCRFQWNIQCCKRRGYSLSSADRSMALTDSFAFNTERCDLMWCLRGKRSWPEWHYLLLSIFWKK